MSNKCNIYKKSNIRIRIYWLLSRCGSSLRMRRVALPEASQAILENFKPKYFFPKFNFQFLSVYEANVFCKKQIFIICALQTLSYRSGSEQSRRVCRKF